MKMIALAFAAFVLLAGSPGTAHAQRYTNYAVCAVYTGRTMSCAFDTMAQCFATVSGRGGFCEPNPWYQPPTRAQRRKNS